MSWKARVWRQKCLEMPRLATIWEGERPRKCSERIGTISSIRSGRSAKMRRGGPKIWLLLHRQGEQGQQGIQIWLAGELPSQLPQDSEHRASGAVPASERVREVLISLAARSERWWN